MLLLGSAGALTSSCWPSPSKSPPPVEGFSVQPARRDFSQELLGQLKVPEGFEVQAFATGLGNVRMLTQAEDGTVYATRRNEEDVIALKDDNGDHRADSVRPVASGLPSVNGIAMKGNLLYLAPPTQVLVAEIRPDGSLASPSVFVDGLPGGGQHPNRTIAFGPDGKFYITIGSTCNECDEPNPDHAAIHRTNADGTGRTIFARGLRNTIGFDWHPKTHELWGMDHGTDWRGDNNPPEELNQIVQDGNYGWPYCFGEKQVDAYTPSKPPGQSREAYCEGTLAPALTYQAHSSPLGLVFYDRSRYPEATRFPSEYDGDAFVTFRGSWNRQTPVGYKVARVRFENGKPVRFEDFLSGFLIEDGKAQFGRPAGITVARDGSLLFADDTNGVIYRVSRRGS
jgi:glucose/arabinose dehydrogenase